MKQIRITEAQKNRLFQSAPPKVRVIALDKNFREMASPFMCDRKLLELFDTLGYRELLNYLPKYPSLYQGETQSISDFINSYYDNQVPFFNGTTTIYVMHQEDIN